jgi:hypothetical protein
MNPEQYLLTISMIIAAQTPMRQLHAAPLPDVSPGSTLVATALKSCRYVPPSHPEQPEYDRLTLVEH